MSKKSIKATGTVMKKKNYDLILLTISIGYLVSTSILMAMYASSKLGPTPIFLPVDLAFLSFCAILYTLRLAWKKKIKLLTIVISVIVNTITIIIQLKAFGDIMYVT